MTGQSATEFEDNEGARQPTGMETQSACQRGDGSGKYLRGNPYEIKDGKIQSDLCELNVCHHCNLSCRGCSHLSPRIGKFFVDPDTAFRDFSILAHFYRPKRVSLLGGEPLLHPALLDVIHAVRRSGISQCIRIVTNGTLLARMPEKVWASLDEVHVSAYPGLKLANRDVRTWRTIARSHGVEFQLRYTDRFWEAWSELGTRDPKLVNRIYSACQIAQTWRCHAVCEGFFFRCSQSIFIPLALGKRAGLKPMVDGLRLERREGFAEELLRFLEAREPLASCGHCLGTSGKRFFPVQEPRRTCAPPKTTEQLLDWRHLARLEKGHSAFEVSLVKHWGVFLKKMLAVLPFLVRLNPLLLRAIARLRRIHSAFY